MPTKIEREQRREFGRRIIEQHCPTCEAKPNTWCVRSPTDKRLARQLHEGRVNAARSVILKEEEQAAARPPSKRKKRSTKR